MDCERTLYMYKPTCPSLADQCTIMLTTANTYRNNDTAFGDDVITDDKDSVNAFNTQSMQCYRDSYIRTRSISYVCKAEDTDHQWHSHVPI